MNIDGSCPFHHENEENINDLFKNVPWHTIPGQPLVFIVLTWTIHIFISLIDWNILGTIKADIIKYSLTHWKDLSLFAGYLKS